MAPQLGMVPCLTLYVCFAYYGLTHLADAIVKNDIARVYDKIEEGAGMYTRAHTHTHTHTHTHKATQRTSASRACSIVCGDVCMCVYVCVCVCADVNFVFGTKYSCPEGYTPLMVAAHRNRQACTHTHTHTHTRLRVCRAACVLVLVAA